MIKEVLAEAFSGCLKWIILAIVLVAIISFLIGKFI